MDLLIYKHLVPQIGQIVLEFIATDLFLCIDGSHYLLRTGSLTKYNERRCFMSHHRCFIASNNQVKIICNDFCPTKDNIGWVDCYRECYDCLSMPKYWNVSQMWINYSGQNGTDTMIKQLISKFLCDHDKTCTIRTQLGELHQNIDCNSCAIYKDEIIYLAHNHLIKRNLVELHFSSFSLCSDLIGKNVEEIIIDGDIVILFSKSSEDKLCLHQFDLLEETWTCTTIGNVTIGKFSILKGKYNPKSQKRKFHLS